MRSVILFLFVLAITGKPAFSQSAKDSISFDFYGDPINLPYNQSDFIDFRDSLSTRSITEFYEKIRQAESFQLMVRSLLSYKKQYTLDDWLYYQLIRRTAQQISPKAANYDRYTLYKWFLLTHSGYDAILCVAGNRVLFYVQSDENIYNIPYRIRDDKQYVCLNYHDYSNIDFEKERFNEVVIRVPEAHKAFSYKVTQLPNFRPGDYLEKDLRFNYNNQDYYFKVKLNPQIKTIFANYPVTDYESNFNIPLSKETYGSLIPLLKKSVKRMSTENGVDFLMRFTRYAFLFEPDSQNFGKEKRLSPEQTLLYEYSDCEDRAALFFYLVREIYNLPMIVLSFPQHITVAVKFDKPIGKPILYKGMKYTICEPTPQKEDLPIGQMIPQLKKAPYEIAYTYTPQ